MGFPSPLSTSDRVILKSILRRHPARHIAETALGVDLDKAKIADLAAFCQTVGIDAEQAIAAHKHNMTSTVDRATRDLTVAIQDDVEAELDAMPDAEPDAELDAEPDAETTPDRDAIADLARSVLAPVEAFAAPSIMDALQRNLDGLVTLARDEIDRVTVQARNAIPAVPAVAGSLVSSRRGADTLGNVFALGKASKGKEWLSLRVSTWTARTETIDRNYIHSAETLGAAMASVERGSGVWLHGPKGSGKTELCRQIAARTGRPFTRISMADDMDKYALLGQRIPDASGAFTWTDGLLTSAIRVPGMLICLDEVSAAKTGFLFLLQTCLDVRRLTLEETGETIPFADGVSFIACDNTDGFGDTSGRYGGTGVLNEAFLDRFPRKIEMGTADKALLADIINARTGLARPASEMLAGLIKTSESMAVSGKLSTHLSLRPVLLFAHDVQDGLPLQKCLETSILSALPATEAQAMRQHVLAQLDLAALAIAAGKSIAAPSVKSQAAQNAANDFSK